jgi:chloramphenicol 3-O-phosphotransferase
MKQRRSTVIRLKAPKPTLIDRMVSRGDERETAAEWLAQQGGTHLRADLEIDTTSGTPAEIAKQIESHLAL